jgi:hypothetical protein
MGLTPEEEMALLSWMDQLKVTLIIRYDLPRSNLSR